MTTDRVIQIEAIDDPRIEAYTRLKERDLARLGRRFIAEGELVVRRLLSSPYGVESLLLASRKATAIAPLAPAHAMVYVADESLVNRIVGYRFHSGVMAVGLRGAPRRLADVAAGWGNRPLTLVICPEIANTENLGSLMRISAAFGVDAMVLGERCCDPFYRQSIRVSMGAVFSLPLVESENLLADLRELKARHGVELLATVVGREAEPLTQAKRGERIGLMFGNEAQGLGETYIAAAERKVTIPMRLGIDSLNVSVSAGVFLYHFAQRVAKA